MENLKEEIIKKLREYDISYVEIKNETSLKIIHDLWVHNKIKEGYLDDDAICNYYGLYFEYIGDYEKMQKYYLMAIEKGNIPAMYNLGSYYCEMEDYKNMKKYYSMAIERGDCNSMNNLGRYYCKKKSTKIWKNTF